MSRAEREFRAAFQRLKANKPKRLPKGTPVTQNNVAREAGKDPSALKKSRYPELVSKIQQFVESSGRRKTPSAQSALKSARNRSRKLAGDIESVTAQRDLALSHVLSLQLEVLDLWQQLQTYKAAATRNVLPIKKGAKH